MYMCVLLLDVFNGGSTSIKEINRKAVLLFDVFNGGSTSIKVINRESSSFI